MLSNFYLSQPFEPIISLFASGLSQIDLKNQNLTPKEYALMGVKMAN
jgi:hypothetical protein